eukprot:TRINITY_DN23104_c0_g1_i1.p1 TRINITY_DN23104_c0_g1~~TRINITY_DN23104_c0_g1_i1.p1  ORF type:complete len:371 (-),score=54.69 TRINITY_DN23104_c0_g1_i1:660-1772(-)
MAARSIAGSALACTNLSVTVPQSNAPCPVSSFRGSQLNVRKSPSLSSPSGRRAYGKGIAICGEKTTVHQLIRENSSILLPGCYDALSAMIVQKTGFPGAFISGYATSASLLGAPDFGILTPPEMCEVAKYICNAVPSLPVIVDADTGGGGALNVQRTVKELIAVGAAGCFLEDQVWPKKCGHMRGKQVIPAEEHAQKIAAAREAIGNADFFLVARTDARATSKRYGLQDAIQRANLYMEAGADASFVEAPRDDDELRAIGEQTKGLRVCNMLEGGATPLHTPEELEAMGFQIVIHPLTSLYAATRAILDSLGELKQKGTTKETLPKLATFKEFNELIGLEEWFARESRYNLTSVPSPSASTPSYSTISAK